MLHPTSLDLTSKTKPSHPWFTHGSAAYDHVRFEPETAQATRSILSPQEHDRCMVSNWLLVAVGGAAGAVLRVYLSETIPSSGFPWATLSVNLVGSLLLGAITAAALTNVVDEAAALMLGAGFLGAFTTMSTFSVETIALVDEGRWSAAGAYVIFSGLVCPIFAFLGWKSTQSWVG